MFTAICNCSRSYILYTDSIYNKTSLFAAKCPSCVDYESKKCTNNMKFAMRHNIFVLPDEHIQKSIKNINSTK